MASKVLFESLKTFLAAMMCLGIFPWRFVQDGESSAFEMKPLKWKTHLAIFLANVTMWSLPFDVHFWYGLLSALHPNQSQTSTNGLGQIRNESSLILFLLVITNNLLIFYGIPLMHHFHILRSRNRICQFYKDIQAQLYNFNISWNSKKMVILPMIGISIIILTYTILSILYAFGPAASALRIHDNEPMEFLHLIYVIGYLRSCLFCLCAVTVASEIIYALLAWITSTKEKLSQKLEPTKINAILDECLVLIETCEKARKLFSWYLDWWAFKLLYFFTYTITTLAVAIFQALIGTKGGGMELGHTFSEIVGFVLGILITSWLFAPPYKLMNELQSIKRKLKSIYVPKRLKFKWNNESVPATFVMEQIIDKINGFKGFVTVGSNTIIVWFFTFFLFFIQFGVQAPESEDNRDNQFTCDICENCTNLTMICTK